MQWSLHALTANKTYKNVLFIVWQTKRLANWTDE